MDHFAPHDAIARYQADPSLRPRLEVNETGQIRYLAFNLAVPPFDDVYVRKAINFVLDKQAIADQWQKTGVGPAAVYTHLAPNRQENNLLAQYDPYASSGHHGDLSAARQAMAQSRYDANHDGLCDVSACSVRVLWRDRFGYREMESLVAASMAKIGITLEPKFVDGFTMYSMCGDPANHETLCQVGWAGDYPSASTYFPPLYGSAASGGSFNFSLTGATPQQLEKWRYPVHEVPNLDQRMDGCSTKLEADQVQCWAGFDQYLMEEVVPAVPVLTDIAPWTFSARVAHFSWDTVTGVPALDNIALKPGA
jgi:ABC-type transport system substrate-binding protein